MNTEPRNMIGPRVRKFRRAGGWTVADLTLRVAARGGELSVSDVRRIEQRTRRVKDHEVLRLAIALGVDTEELFPRRWK